VQLQIHFTLLPRRILSSINCACVGGATCTTAVSASKWETWLEEDFPSLGEWQGNKEGSFTL